MNIQKIMKQAQEMQQKMMELQTRVEAEETEGSAGGGMVTVKLNGKGALLSVSIDPKLIDPSEKEMLEDLIVAAHNDAKKKTEDSFSSQMSALSGNMGLPPGFKLPF